MTSETEKIISEQWENLPQEVRRFFDDPNWKDKISKVAADNSLTDTQFRVFMTETLLVILGLSDPETYMLEIRDRLGVVEEKAVTIAAQVENKVFGNLKNKMKEFYATGPTVNVVSKEKIQNVKALNPLWSENLDFILSGGDYSAFTTPEERGEVPVLDPLGRDLRREPSKETGLEIRPEELES